MSAAPFPLDDDPLPARPTPADLAPVPPHELMETHGVIVSSLASQRPRPPGERANRAIYALAAGQAVLERISAERAALARIALADGASPAEVAAALGAFPETGTDTGGEVADGGFRAGFPAGPGAGRVVGETAAEVVPETARRAQLETAGGSGRKPARVSGNPTGGPRR